MPQSLFPKRYSSACDDHHFSALVLQHCHLKRHQICPTTYNQFAVNAFSVIQLNYYNKMTIISLTCSTIEASLPSARPHSSPRVTTALPNFTTIRLACLSSPRCANDLPWARASGTVRKGTLLQWRTAWHLTDEEEVCSGGRDTQGRSQWGEMACGESMRTGKAKNKGHASKQMGRNAGSA